MWPEEPPRPVCPTGGEAKRRRVRPSVRPSVAVLQHFSSTRVSPFSKCYVGNAIHRRLHCVVFSPVHPQRCKGYQTHNSPYSSKCKQSTVEQQKNSSAENWTTIVKKIKILESPFTILWKWDKTFLQSSFKMLFQLWWNSATVQKSVEFSPYKNKGPSHSHSQV